MYQVQPTAALFILWPSFLVTDEFLAHYFSGKKGYLFPPIFLSLFFFFTVWRNTYLHGISLLELYIYSPHLIM